MAAEDSALATISLSRKLLLLGATALTAVLVAITYHYFESAVHYSTNLVWNMWFKTGSQRLVLIPVCIFLTLIYFGTQHLLDAKAEKQESKGLGSVPEATPSNYLKVVAIGFLSLVAGASLGPEAILVPACMIIGAFIGKRMFPNQKPLIELLSALGFVALFAAFFNSFVAGLLGLLLISKQTKTRLNLPLVLLSVLASYATVATLGILEGSAYMPIPQTVDAPDFWSAITLIGLVVAGFGITYGIKIAHRVFSADFAFLKQTAWWNRALLAGAGLSTFYLLGGPLVRFTGNQSIAPLIQQAAGLGLAGILWILVIKILAIAWSKALGYRGGLVFPSIFVASAAVVLAQLYVSSLSFVVGLMAVMVGVIVADSRAKILF